MDLLLNLADWLLSPVILALIILLTIIAAVASIPMLSRRRFNRFAQEINKQLAGQDIEPVAYLTQEDIASGKLTRAVVKQGIIALASSGMVTLFLYTPKGKSLKYEFAGKDEQISYIDNDRFGSVLPSMVRIYAAGRSHYLFKNSKLGSAHIKLTRRLFERLHHQWSSQPATTPLRPNKSTRSALIGVLLVVMACVGFTLWSSWEQSIEYAPMLLEKTESGKVIAASHHILYAFHADGTLYDRIELENLGLPEGISDMQSLSEVDFLVADRDTSVIKWCSLDDKTCSKLPGFKREALFLRTFQFHYDGSRQRIYAADTARHRLLELSAEGELIREIVNSSVLCFPNDPVIVGERLYVANSNHHEIVAWDLNVKNFEQPVARWLTVSKGRRDVNCPAPVETPGLEFFARERLRAVTGLAQPYAEGRRGRVWPFALELGKDGLWWVINGGKNLLRGDVIKLSLGPPLITPQRVELPTKVDPITLLARERDVLIAETAHPAILRVDYQGNLLDPFGDANFLAEMAQQRAKRDQYFYYRILGISALLIFLAIIVGSLILLRDRRLREIAAQDPALG